LNLPLAACLVGLFPPKLLLLPPFLAPGYAAAPPQGLCMCLSIGPFFFFFFFFFFFEFAALLIALLPFVRRKSN
jgi:hypothetical protein